LSSHKQPSGGIGIKPNFSVEKRSARKTRSKNRESTERAGITGSLRMKRVGFFLCALRVLRVSTAFLRLNTKRCHRPMQCSRGRNAGGLIIEGVQHFIERLWSHRTIIANFSESGQKSGDIDHTRGGG